MNGAVLLKLFMLLLFILQHTLVPGMPFIMLLVKLSARTYHKIDLRDALLSHFKNPDSQPNLQLVFCKHIRMTKSQAGLICILSKHFPVTEDASVKFLGNSHYFLMCQLGMCGLSSLRLIRLHNM
jgi:hypothetical protein